MKQYYIFITALLFLLTLCSCKKETTLEYNDTTLTKTNPEKTSTLKINMNDIHKIYGTLIAIEDIYNPEDMDKINDDAAPVGICLTINLKQHDSQQNTYVLIELTTGNIGIDGTKIHAENESFPVGTDVVIEYYGELEDISDNQFLCYPDENRILYKINYIKSLRKITDEDTSTINLNDVHRIYGTLIAIEDIYNPEDIDKINDDDVVPSGVHLIFKLKQQNSAQTTCVSVSITNSTGIDGNKIWIKDTNDDSFQIGTDAVIEYYGKLEDVSDDILYCGIYNPDYDVYYDNKIVYKINYIKSISKATADE